MSSYGNHLGDRPPRDDHGQRGGTEKYCVRRSAAAPSRTIRDPAAILVSMGKEGLGMPSAGPGGGGLGAVVLSAVVFTRGSDTPSAQPRRHRRSSQHHHGHDRPDSRPSAPTPLGLEPSTPGMPGRQHHRPERRRHPGGERETGDNRLAQRPRARRDSMVNVYLDRSSVQCGGTVAISLRGTGAPAIIRVFRLGWYAGNGGREMWRSGPVLARPAAVPPPSGPTRTVVLSLAGGRSPSRSHPPGPRAVCRHGRTGGRSLPDESGPWSSGPMACPRPLLVMDSDLTWAAYNSFGGSDLYRGIADGENGTVAGRSYEVMLARPLTSMGLSQFVSRDAAVAALIESNGFSVGYTTDASVDNDPGQLFSHHGLIIPGHSEYWTRRMLDGVTAARGAGVNLAFLGANICYWQARVTRDASGSHARSS